MQRLALKDVCCFKHRTCEHRFNRPPSTLLTLSELPKRRFPSKSTVLHIVLIQWSYTLLCLLSRRHQQEKGSECTSLQSPMAAQWTST